MLQILFYHYLYCRFKEIIQIYQSEILSFHKLILFTIQHYFENYFELPILMLSTKKIN